MRDGQPLLLGPDGEALFVFQSHKPYRRNLAGFRPPEEIDEASGTVLDDEGPTCGCESDEEAEALWVEGSASAEAED